MSNWTKALLVTMALLAMFGFVCLLVWLWHPFAYIIPTSFAFVFLTWIIKLDFDERDRQKRLQRERAEHWKNFPKPPQTNGRPPPLPVSSEGI